MSEPFRAMAVEEITASKFRIPRWSYVWCFDELSKAAAVVEFKGKRTTVSSKMLVKTPVRQADAETLEARDPCFGQKLSSFVEVHRDAENLFQIFRCKAHNNYFLNDVQGGIAMYARLTFLGKIESPSEQEFFRLWREFHYKSTDRLFYEGLAAFPSE